MPAPIDLWKYTFNSRSADEERAYREHYLDTDIRHLNTTFYAVTIVIAAMSVLDITLLSEQPGLLLGLIFKLSFLFMTVAVVLIVNRARKAWVLDLCVVVYAIIYATGVVMAHAFGEYSAARMSVIITLCIFTAHIAFPVYIAYLLPPVVIGAIGESIILFTTDRTDLIQVRPLMLVVFVFGCVLTVIASALHHRTRWSSFRALQEVKVLSGFLPICASCKQIRDDNGYYQEIEKYISERSEIVFSHGICPDCKEEYYGEFLSKQDEQAEHSDNENGRTTSEDNN